MNKNIILKFLNKYLDIENIPDYSANGLQVDGKSEITKIGFTVDACMDTFKKAKKEGCDMLITHHGIFWDKIGPIVNNNFNRIKFLIKNDISLYSVHAPLDKHPICGNNAQLLKMYKLKPKYEFGFDNDINWGFYDTLRRPITIEKAIEIIKPLNPKPIILKFGPKKIKRIATVSGGAGFSIPEAISKRIDLLIIGELKHSNYHVVKEGNLNLIAPGHYHTETLGVLALEEIIRKKFKVKTTFIHNPTGL